MAKSKRKTRSTKKKTATTTRSKKSKKAASSRSSKATTKKRTTKTASAGGKTKKSRAAATDSPAPAKASKPSESAASKTRATKSAKAAAAASATEPKGAASRSAGTAKARSDDASGNSQARSVAALASAAQADAQGYVFINGRRVRMISTKGRHPPKKGKDRKAPGAEPSAEQAKVKVVKSRLSAKDLEMFRELLVLKRAQLVGDLSAIEMQALQSSGGDLSHMPIHMADIGSDTYDQDFMLGLAAKDRELIREIDASLERIDAGTYGVCQLTGKVIPKARLKAKPWAKYTVEAARQLEMGRGG